MLSFHKEGKHEHEQEIRLLHIPFLFDDEGTAQYDFRVSEYRTGLTKFVEVPLFVGDEAKPLISKVKRHDPPPEDNSRPLIKITSIEFGDNEPNFQKETFTDVGYELEDYLVAKFGYPIEVKAELFKTGVAKS